jgi:tRNA C32,U32 (ribose-2'-O)-methylase TrmJ
MDVWSILISVLVFLFFYQVMIKMTKKQKQDQAQSNPQMDLLVEKFERLDRALKYEINDISRSMASLQDLYANSPQQELLSRLERIEQKLEQLGALGPLSNQAPEHKD